jgi:dolichyl-phosphate beta-glucosyltransferase
MKISLCIPLYNEEKIIADTMDAVSIYMKNRFCEDYEIINIDDGSTDRSLEILHEKKDEHTRIVSYSPNRGKGCAVRTGVLAAEGDTVIFTDCDLAYGCEIVGEFYDHMQKNSELDALIGSRSRHPEGYEGYTFFRKLLSKGYLKFISIYGGLKLSDSQSGIKAFRREIAHRVFGLATVDRFAFDLEIILLTRRLGGKIGEYPVKIINHRPSTIHFFRDSMRMIKDVRKIKKRVKKISVD